jgi:hypothetical protein
MIGELSAWHRLRHFADSFGAPLDHVRGSLYGVDAKSVQEFLED